RLVALPFATELRQHLGRELAALDQRLQQCLLERLERLVLPILTAPAPPGVIVRTTLEPALQQEIGESLQQVLYVEGVQDGAGVLRVGRVPHGASAEGRILQYSGIPAARAFRRPRLRRLRPPSYSSDHGLSETDRRRGARALEAGGAAAGGGRERRHAEPHARAGATWWADGRAGDDRCAGSGHRPGVRAHRRRRAATPRVGGPPPGPT